MLYKWIRVPISPLGLSLFDDRILDKNLDNKYNINSVLLKKDDG